MSNRLEATAGRALHHLLDVPAITARANYLRMPGTDISGPYIEICHWQASPLSIIDWLANTTPDLSAAPSEERVSTHLYIAGQSGAFSALSVLPAVTRLQYRVVSTMNLWRTLGTCAQALSSPPLFQWLSDLDRCLTAPTSHAVPPTQHACTERNPEYPRGLTSLPGQVSGRKADMSPWYPKKLQPFSVTASGLIGRPIGVLLSSKAG